MDTQPTTDPEVAAYARRVREALADVPAARAEELLEDLEEHLVEVAAEAPGPLADRLGPRPTTPRSCAGPQACRRAARRGTEPGGWRSDLRRHRARYGDHRAVVAVRQFLPELRPAWWVVRGWAAVAVVDYYLQGEVTMPLPSLRIGVLGWVITLGVVVWSVRSGLRTRAAGAPLTHGRAALEPGACPVHTARRDRGGQPVRLRDVHRAGLLRPRADHAAPTRTGRRSPTSSRTARTASR